MKTDNPLKQGAIAKNSVGLGTVTPKMVQKRAIELAKMDGRSTQEVTSADLQQAQKELTGQPVIDDKEAVLESAPESERWDPLPGSTGHKVPVAGSEDEDEEGRSDNEKLVEEGIEDAEYDQMAQASKMKRKSS